jgi:hypothetical protein
MIDNFSTEGFDVFGKVILTILTIACKESGENISAFLESDSNSSTNRDKVLFGLKMYCSFFYSIPYYVKCRIHFRTHFGVKLKLK